MQRRNNCERLARQITAFLTKGIHPEPAVRHFIDSTFAHPSRHELEIILKDPDNCEKDTLLELIFFPGQDLQIALEELIEEGHFQQDEEAVVLDLLMKQNLETSLYYPESGPPVRVAIPRHAARQFISRLNIHKQISSRVLGAIRKNLPPDLQVPVKVMIRNTRFACRDSKTAFLETFMGGMPFMGDDFLRHLELMLHLLETCPDGIPLEESLALQKQQHQKNIMRAEQFEQQRKNRNVETMIMQGIRILHYDPRDDMQKIAMLDTVSLALYGKTA